MTEKFNQTEYVREYIKKHKKRFLVDLNKEEMEELNKLLKKNNLTKASFLRKAIENLKK